MVYATVAKGYRIGGATPPLPVVACGRHIPRPYNSDTVWSYEIGTKDRFFDRTLQVSASAYYIKWSNIQQAIYVPLCGIQFTTNAGDAVSKGFDFQAQWQVTHAFELELAVGYTDATVHQERARSRTATCWPQGDALDVVAVDRDAGRRSTTSPGRP